MEWASLAREALSSLFHSVSQDRISVDLRFTAGKLMLRNDTSALFRVDFKYRDLSDKRVLYNLMTAVLPPSAHADAAAAIRRLGKLGNMDDEVYEEYQPELKHKESALSKENASPTDSDLEQLNDLMLNLLIIVTRDARHEQGSLQQRPHAMTTAIGPTAKTHFYTDFYTGSCMCNLFDVRKLYHPTPL
ncbi:hypothetical protein WJX82_000888 [Trebouxia sp. C0006]